MGRLNYNIYSNITDDAFNVICERLKATESKMNKILSSDKWRLHSPVANSDALFIDFVKRDSNVYGNIGVAFEDRPNKISL